MPFVSLDQKFYLISRAKSFSPIHFHDSVNVAAFHSTQVTFLDVLVDLHLWKLNANVLESVRGCFTNSQDTTVYQFLAPHWPHLLTQGPCSASFHVQTRLTQTHGTGAMLLPLTPSHVSFCMHLKRCLPTDWNERKEYMPETYVCLHCVSEFPNCAFLGWWQPKQVKCYFLAQIMLCVHAVTRVCME